MKKRKPPMPRPGKAIGSRPLIAIVGRPNVGKSTLFNRLARQRVAIVEDVPGVTRDRHYADALLYGREVVLIDTGGFDPEGDDPFMSGIATHVKMALEECDLVVCVFDGTVDPLPADREAVKLLRGTDKPVFFVANKADSQKKSLGSVSYYELGLDKVFPVSALHNRGLGDLEEALVEALPEPADEPEEVDLRIPRVAIVGRPNAGKSSLVNRLIGEARQLVTDTPGTTVDSVDTLLERGDQRLILIDTAGIRRKTKVRKKGENVEALSIYQAIRAMERSDVVVMMIDAHLGVGEQDAKIAGLAVDRGRALIVALNKTDLMSKDELKAAITRAKEVLTFARWAPFVPTSALTGRGTGKVLQEIDRVIKSHRTRIKTGELNRFFEEVLERHPPPTQKNRPIKLYYVTQADARPPTFVFVTNYPDLVHFSYQRYVANQLRERFGFHGTPLRIRYRAKRKKELS
ncbi:MAG: ribosome biogenesis GTPase Der [Myxococcota bacterium]